eukprot:6787413-Prymnesium_polylepis.1
MHTDLASSFGVLASLSCLLRGGREALLRQSKRQPAVQQVAHPTLRRSGRPHVVAGAAQHQERTRRAANQDRG